MSKFNSQQSNFSSGELSPKLEGRSDIKEYKDGLALLENFTTINSGGVTKRPGARYIATLANTIAPVIIPFIVDKLTAYIITISPNSFGSVGLSVDDQPIHIYKNDGTAVAFSMSSLDGVSEELDKHGFYWAQSADVLFITHTSGTMEPFIIIRDATDSFSALTWSQSFVNYDTGPTIAGAVKRAIKYPYMDANVNGDIKLNPNSSPSPTALSAETVAAAAVLYFTTDHIGSIFRVTHAGVEGVSLVTDVPGAKQAVTSVSGNVFTRVAHTYSTGDKLYFSTTGAVPPPMSGFVIAAGETPRVAYYLIKLTDDTFSIATTPAKATAGTVLVLASAGSGNLSSHLVDGTKFQSATVTELVAYGAATATDDWQEASWSNFRGFPKTISIYEGRLCWGGTTAQPDYIFMSLSGNFFTMMQNKLDQDSSTNLSGLNYFGTKLGVQPVAFAIGGDETPLIQWMSSDTLLQVGTLSHEYVIGDSATPIDATNSPVTGVKVQTTHGGRDVKAIRAYNSVVFVGRDGKKVRTYKYNNKNGSYISQNLNILSDDMIMSLGAPATGTGTETFSNVSVKQLAHQQSKNILWILTSRNKLISLTFAEETNTVAWSRHEVGGTDVFIHGITSIPSSDGDTDDLWMVVQRTIPGVDASDPVYYLEKMGDDFSHRNLSGNFSNDNDFPWFSDSSIRVTDFGNAKITWDIRKIPGSGTSHLEGETVKVLADGILQADQTVTGGNITIDTAAEEIIVGLSYTAKLNTMDLEAGADSETSKGNKQRIDRVALNLFNSFGGKMGGKASKIHTLKYRTTASNPLYTGILTQTIPADTGEDSRVYLEHSDPLPFTVLAMTVRGKSYD